LPLEWEGDGGGEADSPLDPLAWLGDEPALVAASVEELSPPPLNGSNSSATCWEDVVAREAEGVLRACCFDAFDLEAPLLPLAPPDVPVSVADTGAGARLGTAGLASAEAGVDGAWRAGRRCS
jgi:hypothetical protein